MLKLLRKWHWLHNWSRWQTQNDDDGYVIQWRACTDCNLIVYRHL